MVLKDCLEIFKKEMERAAGDSGNLDRLILDSYVPAEGIYLIVKEDGSIGYPEEIRMDKKTRELEYIPSTYEQICFYDYHSRLVSMDKPQDPKKVIHSNNYLSFWVKQESLQNGKLNEEAIDRYFDVLCNPREKYSKPKDREMYDYIAGQLGEINQEKLERNRKWIKEHIFTLEDLGVTLTGKNYLKIFFEDEDDGYLREEQRYLITKIFNKNDYNIKIGGEILGLPNDNLGLNQKKPYMENRTRKITVPYLVTSEEAVLQRKFFDYLMNQAVKGEVNLFFDMEGKRILSRKKGEMIERDFSGFYLQVRKGKEVEIWHQDVIVDYRYYLKKKFSYQNVLQLPDKDEIYKNYGVKKELQAVIDDVVFSKWLIPNYFTPADELQADGELKRSLLWARDAIFAWLYKGQEKNIGRIMEQVCMNMTKSSIQNGFIPKAGKQFNLMCSLKEYFSGGKQMADRYSNIKDALRNKINQKETDQIKSDEEYFYAVGQLVNYFISLNKSKEKVHSLANPFFNAKNDKIIKERLKQYFMKYNYQLRFNGRRFDHLYAMVCGYVLEGKVDQTAIIEGYLSSNLIYESKKEEEEQ